MYVIHPRLQTASCSCNITASLVLANVVIRNIMSPLTKSGTLKMSPCFAHHNIIQKKFV